MVFGLSVHVVYEEANDGRGRKLKKNIKSREIEGKVEIKYKKGKWVIALKIFKFLSLTKIYLQYPLLIFFYDFLLC